MDNGKVTIHGKEYKTVACRVNEFRVAHPDWSIITELVTAEGAQVVMKASIIDAEGRVIATGYAEEVRNSSNINKTSALENAETSAVGRALAFFGLAGSEIASADEVANAINNQNRKRFEDYKKPEVDKSLRADAEKKIDDADWPDAKKTAMRKNLDDPAFCKNLIEGRVK